MEQVESSFLFSLCSQFWRGLSHLRDSDTPEIPVSYSRDVFGPGACPVLRLPSSPHEFLGAQACRDQFMMAFVGVLWMHKCRAFSAARSSTHEAVYLDTVLSELRITLFDLR